MTTNWRVKIADFGTARLLGSNTSEVILSNFESVFVCYSVFFNGVDSRLISDTEMTTQKGTQAYMAPEIWSSKSYGPEGRFSLFKSFMPIRSHHGSFRNANIVDVYSFGMTMWVISQGTGEEPFQSGVSNSSIAERVTRRGNIEEWRVWGRWTQRFLSSERPPIGPSWPRDISQLIEDCWRDSAKERPLFDDISAELLFLDLNDDWQPTFRGNKRFRWMVS